MNNNMDVITLQEKHRVVSLAFYEACKFIRMLPIPTMDQIPEEVFMDSWECWFYGSDDPDGKLFVEYFLSKAINILKEK